MEFNFHLMAHKAGNFPQMWKGWEWKFAQKQQREEKRRLWQQTIKPLKAFVQQTEKESEFVTETYTL